MLPGACNGVIYGRITLVTSLRCYMMHGSPTMALASYTNLGCKSRKKGSFDTGCEEDEVLVMCCLLLKQPSIDACLTVALWCTNADVPGMSIWQVGKVFCLHEVSLRCYCIRFQRKCSSVCSVSYTQIN